MHGVGHLRLFRVHIHRDMSLTHTDTGAADAASQQVPIWGTRGHGVRMHMHMPQISFTFTGTRIQVTTDHDKI